MKLLLFVCSLGFFSFAFAQVDIQKSEDSSVVVSDIIISGNKKTRDGIILRELLFKKGDTIATTALDDKLLQSRAFVFNTTLFVDVEVKSTKLDSNKIIVLILVKERWYIFPLPYFKLVDRNFNEWWVNQNRDLSRVNYGIKFFHNNLSGRNDKLNIWLISGYNRQVSLKYENPFSNKKLTNGFAIGFIQSKQKEINYQTSNLNKQEFYKLENDFAKSFIRVEFAFTIRPDQRLKHIFKTGYTAESIHDSIAFKNPDYYGNGTTSLNYFDFAYLLQYANTDYNAYPTKGFIGGFAIYHRGINNENGYTQISASANWIKPVSKKIFFRTRLSGTIKFPFSSSYINQNLFGYGDLQVRGLENYVVDGMAGIMSRNSIITKLFDINLKLPIKSNIYNVIPFKFYGKFFSDFGYSHNPFTGNDLLSNKLMYSYGFGIDVVSIYDFVFKFEYSFNQFGNQNFVFGNRN
jgi:outer membrane protein assembly factor BamA